MVGEIARRILDHPHPEIADVERAPQRVPGLAGMPRGFDLAPVGDGEGRGGEFHGEGPVSVPAVSLLAHARPAVSVIARSPCDEAIQTAAAVAVWIASLRSQGRGAACSNVRPSP